MKRVRTCLRREREYQERELAAWDLYARRRGYKHGVAKPVHLSNITSPDQVVNTHRKIGRLY